jgi:hypothetical protein
MKSSNVCYGFLVFLLWCANSWGVQEFLYPVGTITHAEKEKICVLYQKDAHLELWLWDPDSLQAVKGLLSSYTPAGLRVLPNQRAFSFIDNDRVRVKDLAKRSPRTIDLPYGPYDFSTIEWIDSTSFYFSAREREHLNLFHATTEGELFHLTRSTVTNYMYPQKKGDMLFYVTKNEDGICSIEQVKYPIASVKRKSVFVDKKDFKERVKWILEEENQILNKTYLDITSQKVLYQSENTKTDIAFLSMKNAKNGYFLTHPSMVSRHDSHMVFECYHLNLSEDEWQVHKLFSFCIPLHLLMPQHNKEERLYESMLPLLPVHSEDSIYYSHDAGMGLNVYKYELATSDSIQLTEFQGMHHFFAPIFFKGKFYYGGTLCHGDGLSHRCPQMWINEKGMQRFGFPVL